MAGHLLLSFRSLDIVYAALTCLVIGNGLFKPNISTMVGNLYPDGSALKDRAFVIFYFGINVGAFVAPVVMEVVKQQVGYHPAFAVAAFGMVISLLTLFLFRHSVRQADTPVQASPNESAGASQLDSVPDSSRVIALLVVFAIVVVFWMAFHQNGSTLTYWADDNTDWNVSGTIANAINPAWILILSFPLVALWGWLGKRGKEPSTPAKMTAGMLLTGLSFFVLYWAARVGEASVAGADIYDYRVSPAWLICSYGIVTLGELLLSPMGLSLVSKVAPPPPAGNDDGRLVRGHGHRQQADRHRRVLDALAALHLLCRPRRDVRPGRRAAGGPAQAPEAGDAGGLNRWRARLRPVLVSNLFGCCVAAAAGPRGRSSVG